MYSVHNFTGTNFSTELILVQKRACTKSYKNKFRPKISCYTVVVVVVVFFYFPSEASTVMNTTLKRADNRVEGCGVRKKK